MTSHENPYFIKHGVVHYCVPNIPARYPKTASVAISNIITPYLLEIAEAGSIEQAIRSKYGLRSGVYCYKGIPTNKSVASWFDMSYSDIDRKSTRLNSSHVAISYAVFCLKKKRQKDRLI